MLQFQIRTIAAVDVLGSQFLPQQCVASIFLQDAEGRSVELWSQESRSFPTLSDIEAEGAKYFDGLPEAMSYAEAQAAALEWIRTTLLETKTGLDRTLLYPRAKSGECELDGPEEIELRATG